jgi:glycosyltransferase involved in cell wall biosynthesis
VKVSIIIPLYNKSPYIERALASIAAQTFRDFQVIVVDDGSTDDGPKKIQRMAIGSDPKAMVGRLIRQANAGPGAARNRGISKAQGELLAFLDADDEWLPDYLAENVRLLEEQGPKVSAITSGYFEWPAKVSRESWWRNRGLTEGRHCLTPATPAPLVVAMLAYMSPCSTLVRAEVVRQLGGFFSGRGCLYAEDAFLWLKVLLNHPVAFHMAPLVRFHTEASGLSKNLARARPIEPFLLYPEEIEAVCPERLHGLLREVLAIRALKTCCVLGFWGQWRESRALWARFRVSRASRLPYYFPALVCCTPVGKWLGSVWRWRVSEMICGR